VTRALGFLRHLVLLLAAGLIGLAAAAHAQDYPPRPDGPVYDGANILSAGTKAQLDQQLRAYNKETGRAIIVATVPSLGGETIETYATTLFTDKWGIGGAQRDMGLLLLIAPAERKMRIEVGYGLHGYFGGIMAGRVINDMIAPRFKEGNFDAGVTDGVNAILAHLAKSPADAAAIEEAAQAAQAQKSRSDGGFPFGVLIWIAFVFFLFILPLMRRGRRYRSRGNGPWGSRDLGDTARDVILWEVGSAIVRGLADGGRDGGGGGGDWGGGGFGGFGGGSSGGGGASGGW
jgi:uncharacterized protein